MKPILAIISALLITLIPFFIIYNKDLFFTFISIILDIYLHNFHNFGRGNIYMVFKWIIKLDIVFIMG